MPSLRIEHRVPDFEGWKQAFDSDPADRRGSGVRRYRVLRSVEDPNFVMIDLEFDSLAEAEGLLNKMRQIWRGPGKAVMMDPRAHIAETVETKHL
jgi:hypothetical protein